jgi:hypothetical protein
MDPLMPINDQIIMIFDDDVDETTMTRRGVPRR